jgi:hypothetical protein
MHIFTEEIARPGLGHDATVNQAISALLLLNYQEFDIDLPPIRLAQSPARRVSRLF